MATNVYNVPPIRRPKALRLRKNGRTGRPELVRDWGGGITEILTYEEVKAETERQRAGKGLRS